MADQGKPNVCNCCAPSCPVPILDGQQLLVTGGQCGYIGVAGQFFTEYKREYIVTSTAEEEYRISTRAFRADTTCETTVVESADYQLGGGCSSFSNLVVDGNITTYDGSRPDGTVVNFTDTIGGDAKTNLDLYNNVNDYIDNFGWGDVPTAASSADLTATYTQVDGEFWDDLFLRKSRYRYRIPEGSNTYMKYVVEEVFTPVGYDAQDPQSPQPTTEEKTITWTGPGVEGDDNSWATDWQTLETSELGTKTHELIKYQCYTGGAWITPL